jgi:hypothetical protein
VGRLRLQYLQLTLVLQLLTSKAPGRKLSTRSGEACGWTRQLEVNVVSLETNIGGIRGRKDQGAQDAHLVARALQDKRPVWCTSDGRGQYSSVTRNVRGLPARLPSLHGCWLQLGAGLLHLDTECKRNFMCSQRTCTSSHPNTTRIVPSLFAKPVLL